MGPVVSAAASGVAGGDEDGEGVGEGVGLGVGVGEVLGVEVGVEDEVGDPLETASVVEADSSRPRAVGALELPQAARAMAAITTPTSPT